MMPDSDSGWASDGRIRDVLQHKLLVHDGYLSTEALSTALATCKSWARLAPPGVTFAAAVNDALLGRREDLPRGMHELPADVRRYIATVIAPNALTRIPVVEPGDEGWWIVVSDGDRRLDDDERTADYLVRSGVLLALSCVACMCKDFEVSDVPAETAEALLRIAERLAGIHFCENYDTCQELLGIGNGPQALRDRGAADKSIMLTLGDLARYSAHSAGLLFDVVYNYLKDGSGWSNLKKLDDDDNALLARIAPWVPVKQLDLIFRTVFSEAHLDGNDGLETLAERAGDVFAHRADAVPSGLALKLIESARDATPLRRAGFTSRHLVQHFASAMGQTAAKASVQLFLPFVDDAETRRWALQVLAWILWGYAVDPEFSAKEPIVTPDEFRRVASHLGAGEDEVHTSLVQVLVCLARADTVGDGNRVLGAAVAAIMPQIMDLVRNKVGDWHLTAVWALLLAEGAIVGAAGVAEFLARNLVQSDVGEFRTIWTAAVCRVAEGTTAADDVLVGALCERFQRRTAGGMPRGLQQMDADFKAIAAFGARAARIAPQLVGLLTQVADAEDELDVQQGHNYNYKWLGCEDVLAALVALGPDVYRQQGASVAEWVRKYFELGNIKRVDEEGDEFVCDIIDEDYFAPSRQIIQSLGVEAAPYARELVLLLQYDRSSGSVPHNILPEEWLLSRCRTLRLIAEFGDRCPSAAVSALLDHVLLWNGSHNVAVGADGRFEAHVFSTLLRLGRDRLAAHAGRILSNLTNPPMHLEYAVGTVELVAALLPNATSRAFLVTLLNDKIRGKARPDDGQEFDERSIAFAAATALRAANCAVDDATAGLIARILTEEPPHEDYRLAGHDVADVEAACAAELGLVKS